MDGELKMREDHYQQKIDALRREMGTLPNLSIAKDETKFHVGVEGISAELIEYTRNPYAVIFEVAVATWGDETYRTKLPHVSPANRFRVVKAALSGATLPQAVEPVNFTYIIRGVSRSGFDQHVRQRLGVAFFSQGVRDNSRLDAGFRLPSELHPDNGGDPVLHKEIVDHVLEFKRLYKKILEKGWGSFQTARAIFPMGCTHSYKGTGNLGAIMAYCRQRLQACEQADVVAVAIAIRKEIDDRFPLIGSHLRPGCDLAKRCTYHTASSLSELFSALFSGCGRWPDPIPYATFNSSCSSYAQIGKELGHTLPPHETWKEYNSYADLTEGDKALFNEGCLRDFDPVTGE